MSFTGDMAIPVPVHFDGHNINIITEFTNSSLPKPKDRTSLYKTELCREWTQSGWCYYGKRCSFAHGLQELRPVFRSKKWRTKRCRNWHTQGYCPYEHRCQFLHDQAAPRRIGDYSEGDGTEEVTPSAAGNMSPPFPGSTPADQTAVGLAVVAPPPNSAQAMPPYYHYDVHPNVDETTDTSGTSDDDDMTCSESDSDKSETDGGRGKNHDRRGSPHSLDSENRMAVAAVPLPPHSMIVSNSKPNSEGGETIKMSKLTADAMEFLPANPPAVITAPMPLTPASPAAGAPTDTTTIHTVTTTKPVPTAGDNTDAEVKQQESAEHDTNNSSVENKVSSVPATSVSGATASAVNVTTSVSDTGVSPPVQQTTDNQSGLSPTLEAGAPTPTQAQAHAQTYAHAQAHTQAIPVHRKKSSRRSRSGKDKRKKKKRRSRDPVITPFNPVQNQPFLNVLAAQHALLQQAAAQNPSDFGWLYGLEQGQAAQDYLQSLGVGGLPPSMNVPQTVNNGELDYYSAQAAAVSVAHAAQAAAAALQAASGMGAPVPLTQQSSTGSSPGYPPLDPHRLFSTSSITDMTSVPNLMNGASSPPIQDWHQFPLPTPSPPPMLTGLGALQSMTNLHTTELFANFAAPPTPNTINLLNSMNAVGGGTSHSVTNPTHSVTNPTYSSANSPNAHTASVTSPHTATGGSVHNSLTSPHAGAPTSLLGSVHNTTSVGNAGASVPHVLPVSTPINGAANLNAALGFSNPSHLASITNLMSSPAPQDFSSLGLGLGNFNIDSNAILDFLASDPNAAPLSAALMGLDLPSVGAHLGSNVIPPLAKTPVPDIFAALSGQHLPIDHHQQSVITGGNMMHHRASPGLPLMSDRLSPTVMQSNSVQNSLGSVHNHQNSTSNVSGSRVTAPVPSVNTLQFKH